MKSILAKQEIYTGICENKEVVWGQLFAPWSFDALRFQILETLDLASNSLHQRELFWIQLVNGAYFRDNILSYGSIVEGLLPVIVSSRKKRC